MSYELKLLDFKAQLATFDYKVPLVCIEDEAVSVKTCAKLGYWSFFIIGSIFYEEMRFGD